MADGGMKLTPPAPAVVESEGKPMTREQRRSKRPRVVRAKTTSIKRLTKRELELGKLLYPDDNHWRPKTRGDCVNGIRPCPYALCKYHTKHDVNPKTGAVKDNFPDLDIEDMDDPRDPRSPRSCALDVADLGGLTLEETGAACNLTRERIRQCEVTAMAQVLASVDSESLREHIEAQGCVSKRRLPILTSKKTPPPWLDEQDDDDAAVESEDDEPEEEPIDVVEAIENLSLAIELGDAAE
jgi:hypothetical protein